MTTSIVEQSDGSSSDVTVGYSREELAQIDIKSFLNNGIFNYALLGSQCAADDEFVYQYEVEDAFI